MKAAFTTEGNTTTQSALSSKPCGMLSGTSRISFRTEPQFFNRSSSLVWSEAFATSARNGANPNARLLSKLINFLMCFPPAVFLGPEPCGMQPGCQCQESSEAQEGHE